MANDILDDLRDWQKGKIDHKSPEPSKGDQ